MESIRTCYDRLHENANISKNGRKTHGQIKEVDSRDDSLKGMAWWLSTCNQGRNTLIKYVRKGWNAAVFHLCLSLFFQRSFAEGNFGPVSSSNDQKWKSHVPEFWCLQGLGQGSQGGSAGNRMKYGGFLKWSEMGVPQNRWVIMKNPSTNGWVGGTPILGNLHMLWAWDGLSMSESYIALRQKHEFEFICATHSVSWEGCLCLSSGKVLRCREHCLTIRMTTRLKKIRCNSGVSGSKQFKDHPNDPMLKEKEGAITTDHSTRSGFMMFHAT